MKIVADMRGVTLSGIRRLYQGAQNFPAQLVDQVPHLSLLCCETLLMLWISLAACVESPCQVITGERRICMAQDVAYLKWFFLSR